CASLLNPSSDSW
nr:immunoglobulin heavy chain junction region [Macaca mulatta]MOX59659.1 immunoglobulin heavy chain junction region [Macaca mulatta]MOX59998.1 immunoglobulin heavy chain junction region [Macaca mulatta]MOX61302.1 immunoglobulin heavy chain junction region [Macaca mulatta]MOX64714.1 immunoglobulin heavy chain junction region [Macaca mulatta]